MQVNLDHIHIFASDVPTTIAFFCSMFGAAIVWDESAAGVRNIRLSLGAAFIHIYDQRPKHPRGGAMHHLGIETDDLDALVERMRANGFHFHTVIREEPTFRYLMVSGPDDLLIELFQCREPARWRIARSAGPGSA